MNVSGALGALFRIIREANAALDRGELPRETAGALRHALARADAVFGVIEKSAEMLAPEIESLIERRTMARASRDFAEADRIRKLLLDRGIVLEDTPQGVRWRRDVGGPPGRS